MKLSDFLSENFPFLVVKFSIYLNRRVFAMYSTWLSLVVFEVFNSNIKVTETMKHHVDIFAFQERCIYLILVTYISKLYVSDA